MRVALPLLLALAACAGTPKGPPEELLSRGRELAEEGRLRAAATHFRAVWDRHRESDEAEEALFRLAETRRELRKGEAAFDAYKQFLDRYPNSRFSVDVAKGEYQLALDYFAGRMPGFLFFKAARQTGVDICDHIQVHFRNSSLADDAVIRAADFLLERGFFVEATEYYRRLLTQYPRSEYVMRARYQLARSLWRQSEGALYDERLLLQAAQAFRDFVGTAKLQEGGEETYAEQIAAAEEAVRRIRGTLAEKQYLIGRFYERRERPGAARVYYRFCVDEYPDTRFATLSRERLDELDGGASG